MTTCQGVVPSVSGNGHQVPAERPYKPKPILVLDMDENLIHSFNDARLAELCIPEYNFNRVLRFTAMEFPCIIFKLPGVEAFLKEMANHYELVLWTAAIQPYAVIVNWLDPEKVVFTKGRYQIECTQLSGGRYIKDLTRLGADLSRVSI